MASYLTYLQSLNPGALHDYRIGHLNDLSNNNVTTTPNGVKWQTGPRGYQLNPETGGMSLGDPSSCQTSTNLSLYLSGEFGRTNLAEDAASLVAKRNSESLVDYDFQLRGPNLLTDGDCEDAGTAGWTAYNSTLTKQTASPYEGTRCLRIEKTGGNGQAMSAVFTVGKGYRVTGVARSDGTNNPGIYNTGIGWVWMGTTSTDWQLFDETIIAQEVEFRIYSRGTIGYYAEYDALYISEVDAPGLLLNAGTSTSYFDYDYRGAQSLAVTCADGAAPKFYVDGSYVGDGDSTLSLGDAGNTLRIGERESDSGRPQDCRLEQALISDSILTAAEITELDRLFPLSAISGRASARVPYQFIKADTIRTGLVGQWASFDTRDDLSTSSNDVVPSGPVTRTEGIYGDAFDFHDTGGLLTVTDDASLQDLSPRTICAWISPRAAAGGKIIEKTEWELSLETGGVLRFTQNAATANGIWDTVIDLNLPTHVAVSWDGSTPTFVINGYEVTPTTFAAISGTETSDVGNNLTIGSGFDGWIDDIRIYNTALTESELSAIYLEGASSPVIDMPQMRLPVSLETVTSGNIGHWSLDTGEWKLDDDGDGRLLECSSAGKLSRKSTLSYGTWTFTFTKALDATDLYIHFIQDGTNSYAFHVDSDGAPKIERFDSGVLGRTITNGGDGRISAATSYDVIITRQIYDGRFYLYVDDIKRGDSGQDETYTESLTFGLELAADDTFRDLVMYPLEGSLGITRVQEDKTTFVESYTRVASYQEIVDLVAGELGGDLPQVGWKAGDGNIPTHWLGAENSSTIFSVTGSPTPGTTPWISSEGAVASEVYPGSSFRKETAVAVDPGTSNDAVFMCLSLVRTGHSNGKVFSTHHGSSDDPGLSIEYFSGEIYASVAGDSRRLLSTPISFDSWFCVVATAKSGGNSYLHLNGAQVDSGSCPSGQWGEGSGIILCGSDVNDAISYAWVGENALTLIWYGDGIADAFNADSYALVKEITRRLEGTYPLQGETPTVTRASAAAGLSGRAGDSGRKYWIASSGLARAGDNGGLRAAPGSTNELYNTVNPDATTGWDKTGGGSTPATLDAGVDDETALETCHEPNGDEVDATCFGPDVFKLDNSAGDAAAYAYSTVQTGNTDTRCTQVIARQTGSGGAELGWRDASSGAFTSLVSVRAGGEYERILSEGDTPPDTDAQTAIHAPAGTVVYFVVPDRRSETIFVSREPIPNWNTASGATREAEVIDTGAELFDEYGAIQARVTPLGWSGTDPGADVRVLSRADTDGDVLTADGSTAGYYMGDGTSEAQAATLTPADEVERLIRTRWNESATMKVSIDDGDDEGSASYDDTLDGAGSLTIAPTAGEIAIRDLKTFHSREGIELDNDQSTLETTNIIIKCPAGGSVTIDWGDGNTTSVVCDGTTNSYDHDYGSTGQYVIRITGTLNQIVSFYCDLQTWISGDISTVSVLTNAEILYLRATRVSGDLSAVSNLTSLERLYLYSTSVSGNLSAVSNLTSMERLILYSTSVSGDLSAVSSLHNLERLYLYSTNVSDYTSTTLSAWNNNDIRINDLGLSSTEVDNFLIDLNDAGGSNGTLYFIAGNDARTSASDDAYAGLLSRGWGGDIT